MQMDNDNYIHRVFRPMTVYVFSMEQLMFLNHVRNFGNNIILHLDATGKVVHPLPGTTKKVFYYAGVVHDTALKQVCPVLEMVTSEHSAYSISQWLLAFEAYCVNNGSGWPTFSTVVVDFSFAIINALIHQWNKLEDLAEYVNLIFNKDEPKIVIKLCCAHMMKNVTKEVNRHFKKDDVKKTLKYFIATVFNMTKLREVEDWFKTLIHVCCSKNLDDNIHKKLNGIFVKNSHETDDALDDEEYFEEKTALYEKSKYYKHFNTIFNSYSHDQDVIVTNKYYNPNMVTAVLKKWLPYLPLWSQVGPQYISGRHSNAVVENWFGLIKNNVLKNDLNLRCTRFLRIVRETVLTIYKKSLLDVKKSRLAVNKKRIHHDMRAEESWNKKVKKTHSYFRNKTLNLIPQPETIIDLTKDEDNIIPFVSELDSIKEFDVTVSSKHSTGIVPQKLQFYPNGLVSGWDYYRKRRSSYVVCYYSNMTPFPDLRIDDFDTLFDHGPSSTRSWLSNFLIDTCFYLFKKDSILNDVNYLNTIQTSNIFGEMSFTSSEVAEMGGIHVEGILLLPYLKMSQHHWCLGIANFITKTFYFVNSFGSSEDETGYYLRKWCNFLPLLGCDCSEWRTGIIKHPTQRDSVNCGIYVLSFSELYFKEKNPDLFRVNEPENYRMTLREYLLEKSDNMTNRCSVCGEMQLEVTAEWVFCNFCLRWIMTQCLDRHGIKYDLKKDPFMCFACEEFFIDSSSLSFT